MDKLDLYRQIVGKLENHFPVVRLSGSVIGICEESQSNQ